MRKTIAGHRMSDAIGLLTAEGRGWLSIQAMPVLAMMVVVLLLGVLLWMLHSNEVEERQRMLIQDVLWIEQDLQFHLGSHSEILIRLAQRIAREGDGADLFIAEARGMINSSHDIRRVVLRDADGRVSRSEPPANPLPGGEVAPDWSDSFILARSLGQPIYGKAFWLGGGGGGAVEIHVPLFVKDRFAGTLSATMSFEAMLAHQVPWWFSQKYRIEIVDTDGVVLAARSQLAAVDPGPGHQVRFDPPGRGLSLVVTLYRAEQRWPRHLLAAAILGMALLAVLSLWGLRGHMRRRVEAEQALRAEHAFRKAMEDSLTVGLRARDLEGRIIYVNPAFCRMVGWGADDLLGTLPPMLYWAPEEIDSSFSAYQMIMRGDAPPEGFEITLCRRSGERFKALVYEAPLIDSEGRQAGWMASVVDITERERAEDVSRQQQEKLQQTARLITMGEMASTLAHELNQPLSAISSYATGCLNRLAGGQVNPEELERALHKLSAQAQRAGQILRRIHDFVRKSEPAVAPCSINRVVEAAIGFIDADARKHGIRVVVTPADANPEVDADRILIEQVLLNLARNAMEAMSATPWFLRQIDVSIQTIGSQVVVRVSDRGSGISAEVASGLFSPFFTTKAEGMGMGLNICRSIIESHRGRLWYEPNTVGVGSVFVFSLPIREA